MFAVSPDVVVSDIIHDLAARATIESAVFNVSSCSLVPHSSTHTTESVPTRDRQPSVSLKILSRLLILYKQGEEGPDPLVEPCTA